MSFQLTPSAGITQADVGVIRDTPQITRLFYHETLRVFHDRLINHEDKDYFYEILAEMAQKYFSEVCVLLSCIRFVPIYIILLCVISLVVLVRL